MDNGVPSTDKLEDISQFKHTNTIQKVVDILCKRNFNFEREEHFHSVYTYYFFASLAANMHITFDSDGKKTLPNLHYMAIAGSGTGKTSACDFLKDNIFEPFMENYSKNISNKDSEIINKNLENYADNFNKSIEEIEAILESMGDIPSSISDITHAALCQIGDYVRLTGVKSLNLNTDEMGSHFNNLVENVFRNINELCDGKIVDKRTMNTKEKKSFVLPNRKIPFVGLSTGSPAKILDNTVNFKEFLQILESGLARRTVYSGFNAKAVEHNKDSIKQIMNFRTASNGDTFLSELSTRLAEPKYFKMNYKFSEEATDLLIEYWLIQNNKANKDKVSENMKNILRSSSAVLSKLACVSAFSRESDGVISVEDVKSAIKLFSHSVSSFYDLENKPEMYELLAEELAKNGTKGRALSSIDIEKEYSSILANENRSQVLITIKKAISLLDDNPNVSVVLHKLNDVSNSKTRTKDAYEVFSKEKTDIHSVSISIGKPCPSEDNFTSLIGSKGSTVVPFHSLSNLLLRDCENGNNLWSPYEWINGIKSSNKTNLLVFNTDSDVSIDYLSLVFKKYHFLIHATKTWKGGRFGSFRVVLPVKYVLDFNSTAYSSLYMSIINFLPVGVSTDKTSLWFTTPRCGYDEETKTYKDKVITPAKKYNNGTDLELFDGYDFLNSQNSDTKNTVALIESHLSKYPDLDKKAKWVLYTYNFDISMGTPIVTDYLKLMCCGNHMDEEQIVANATQLGSKMNPQINSHTIYKYMYEIKNKTL